MRGRPLATVPFVVALLLLPTLPAGEWFLAGPREAEVSAPGPRNAQGGPHTALCFVVRNGITGNPVPEAVINIVPLDGYLIEGKTFQRVTSLQGVAYFDRLPEDGNLAVQVVDPWGWYLPAAFALPPRSPGPCPAPGPDTHVVLLQHASQPFPYTLAGFTIGPSGAGVEVPETTLPPTVEVPPVVQDALRTAEAEQCVFSHQDVLGLVRVVPFNPNCFSFKEDTVCARGVNNTPGTFTPLVPASPFTKVPSLSSPVGSNLQELGYGDGSTVCQRAESGGEGEIGYLEGVVRDASTIAGAPMEGMNVSLAVRAFAQKPRGPAFDRTYNDVRTLAGAEVPDVEQAVPLPLEAVRRAYLDLAVASALKGPTQGVVDVEELRLLLAHSDDRFRYLDVTQGGRFLVACHKAPRSNLDAGLALKFEKLAPVTSGLRQLYAPTSLVVACKPGEKVSLDTLDIPRLEPNIIGTIRNQVRPAEKLVGAEVEATHPILKASVSATLTSDSGNYNLRLPWHTLAEGCWTIVASKAGFVDNPPLEVCLTVDSLPLVPVPSTAALNPITEDPFDKLSTTLPPYLATVDNQFATTLPTLKDRYYGTFGATVPNTLCNGPGAAACVQLGSPLVFSLLGIPRGLVEPQLSAALDTFNRTSGDLERATLRLMSDLMGICKEAVVTYPALLPDTGGLAPREVRQAVPYPAHPASADAERLCADALAGGMAQLAPDLRALEETVARAYLEQLRQAIDQAFGAVAGAGATWPKEADAVAPLRTVLAAACAVALPLGSVPPSVAVPAPAGGQGPVPTSVAVPAAKLQPGACFSAGEKLDQLEAALVAARPLATPPQRYADLEAAVFDAQASTLAALAGACAGQAPELVAECAATPRNLTSLGVAAAFQDLRDAVSRAVWGAELSLYADGWRLTLNETAALGENLTSLFRHTDAAYHRTPRLSENLTLLFADPRVQDAFASLRSTFVLLQGGDAAMGFLASTLDAAITDPPPPAAQDAIGSGLAPVVNEALRPHQLAAAQTLATVERAFGVNVVNIHLAPQKIPRRVFDVSGLGVPDVKVCYNAGKPDEFCHVSDILGNLPLADPSVYAISFTPQGASASLFDAHTCPAVTVPWDKSEDDDGPSSVCWVVLRKGTGVIVARAADATLRNDLSTGKVKEDGAGGLRLCAAGETDGVPVCGTTRVSTGLPAPSSYRDYIGRAPENGTVLLEVPLPAGKGRENFTLTTDGDGRYRSASRDKVLIDTSTFLGRFSKTARDSPLEVARTTANLAFVPFSSQPGDDPIRGGEATFKHPALNLGTTCNKLTSATGTYTCNDRVWVADPFGLGWPTQAYRVEFERVTGRVYPKAVQTWAALPPPLVGNPTIPQRFAFAPAPVVALQGTALDAHVPAGSGVAPGAGTRVQAVASGAVQCTPGVPDYTCSTTADAATGAWTLSVPVTSAAGGGNAAELFRIRLGDEAYQAQELAVADAQGTVGLARTATTLNVTVADAHSGRNISGAFVVASLAGPDASGAAKALVCAPPGGGFACRVRSAGSGNATLTVPWGDLDFQVQGGPYSVRYIATANVETLSTVNAALAESPWTNVPPQASGTGREALPHARLYAVTDNATYLDRAQALTLAPGGSAALTVPLLRAPLTMRGAAHQPAPISPLDPPPAPIAGAVVNAAPVLVPLGRTAAQFCNPQADPALLVCAAGAPTDAGGKFASPVPNARFRAVPVRESELNATMREAFVNTGSSQVNAEFIYGGARLAELDTVYGALGNHSGYLEVDQVWTVVAKKEGTIDGQALATSVVKATEDARAALRTAPSTTIPAPDCARVSGVAVCPLDAVDLVLVEAPKLIRVPVLVVDNADKPLSGVEVCLGQPEGAIRDLDAAPPGDAPGLRANAVSRYEALASGLFFDKLPVADQLRTAIRLAGEDVPASNCAKTGDDGKVAFNTRRSKEQNVEHTRNENQALLRAFKVNFYPRVGTVTLTNADPPETKITLVPLIPSTGVCVPASEAVTDTAVPKVCPPPQAQQARKATKVEILPGTAQPPPGKWNILPPQVQRGLISSGTASTLGVDFTAGNVAFGGTRYDGAANGTWVISFLPDPVVPSSIVGGNIPLQTWKLQLHVDGQPCPPAEVVGIPAGGPGVRTQVSWVVNVHRGCASAVLLRSAAGGDVNPVETQQMRFYTGGS